MISLVSGMSIIIDFAPPQWLTCAELNPDLDETQAQGNDFSGVDFAVFKPDLVGCAISAF